MTIPKYNLSVGIEDGFDFTMNDPKDNKTLTYHFRYPSAADLEPNKEYSTKAEELRAKLEEAKDEEKATIQAEIDGCEQKQLETFYALVTPVDHDCEIGDLLKRVNVKVAQKFNQMVTSEFAE